MKDIVSLARLLAKELHSAQVRKSSGESYFDAHLEPVAQLVERCGGSDHAIAAAYLHDAIEDCGDDCRKKILDECGPVVLALVEECTEEGTGGAVKAPWKERKEAYVAHVSRMYPMPLYIAICDKLQNAQELAQSVRVKGDAAFDIFKKAGSDTAERKQNTLWFHKALLDAFIKRVEDWRRKEPHLIDPIEFDAPLQEFSKLYAVLENK